MGRGRQNEEVFVYMIYAHIFFCVLSFCGHGALLHLSTFLLLELRQATDGGGMNNLHHYLIPAKREEPN